MVICKLNLCSYGPSISDNLATMDRSFKIERLIQNLYLLLCLSIVFLSYLYLSVSRPLGRKVRDRENTWPTGTSHKDNPWKWSSCHVERLTMERYSEGVSEIAVTACGLTSRYAISSLTHGLILVFSLYQPVLSSGYQWFPLPLIIGDPRAGKVNGW